MDVKENKLDYGRPICFDYNLLFGLWRLKIGFGQAEQNCALHVQCTHGQLFLLHCTTSWQQPGLSRGFVDNFTGLSRGFVDNFKKKLKTDLQG